MTITALSTEISLDLNYMSSQFVPIIPAIEKLRRALFFSNCIGDHYFQNTTSFKLVELVEITSQHPAQVEHFFCVLSISVILLSHMKKAHSSILIFSIFSNYSIFPNNHLVLLAQFPITTTSVQIKTFFHNCLHVQLPYFIT